MNEATARSILRIAGILTMLVGAVLLLQAVVGSLLFANATISSIGHQIELDGFVGQAARGAIALNGIVIVMGGLLCSLSPGLARYIASDAARR